MKKDPCVEETLAASKSRSSSSRKEFTDAEIAMFRSIDVYTSGQLARLCQVAPRTASRWIDLGYLQGAYRIPGAGSIITKRGDRRVSRGAVIAFCEKHNIRPALYALGVLSDRHQILFVGFSAKLQDEVILVTADYRNKVSVEFIDDVLDCIGTEKAFAAVFVNAGIEKALVTKVVERSVKKTCPRVFMAYDAQWETPESIEAIGLTPVPDHDIVGHLLGVIAVLPQVVI